MNPLENHGAERQPSPKDQKSDEGSDDLSDLPSDILDYVSSWNWNNTVPQEEYEACKKRFLPNIGKRPTESKALNLIDSHYVKFPKHAINLSKPGKEKMSYYVPGLNKDNMIVEYFIFSELTHSEQSRLFHLLCKMQYEKRKRFYKFQDSVDKDRFFTVQESVDFQKLLQKALKDYNRFQEFVAKQWRDKHVDRCKSIPSDVDKYLNSLWHWLANKCLTYYPHRYQNHKQGGTSWSAPLVFNDPNDDFPRMELLQQKFIKGNLQYLFDYKPNMRVEVESEFSKLCAMRPVTLQHTSSAHLPASLDPVVKSMIMENNVDVVITSSGIKTIVDNFKSTKDWNLPFTVLTVHKDGNEAKKVVIIDKKLPPRSMSAHDKNVWHAKLTSKWLLRSDATKKPDTVGDRTVVEYDDITFDDNEEFGHGAKKKLQTSGLKEMRQSAQNTLESKPEDRLAGQTTYDLWVLRKSKDYNMTKCEQRSINILVRSKIDGMYRRRGVVQLGVCVSSKLDYQPEYGAAEMSLSELVREYISLFLHNQHKLIRVRKVGYTNEVMMMELISMAEISQQLQLKYNLQCSKIFNPLYAVLTKLIDLNEGKYILQHTEKMGPFAAILSAVPDSHESGINLNLLSWLDHLREAEVNVPPALIDRYVVAPIHRRDKRPPAVFKPCFANSSKCRYFLSLNNRQPNRKLHKKKKNKAQKARESN